MIKTISSQQGAGLIETLIIVLFVGISIVAIIRFQHTLSYSTHISQQQSDATLLALSRIESLRDFTVLPTTASYTAYQDIASGSSSLTVSATTYTLNWTVTTNTNPDYKTIDVTASWTDQFGGQQSVRLISRVAGIDPALSAGVM